MLPLQTVPSPEAAARRRMPVPPGEQAGQPFLSSWHLSIRPSGPGYNVRLIEHWSYRKPDVCHPIPMQGGLRRIMSGGFEVEPREHDAYVEDLPLCRHNLCTLWCVLAQLGAEMISEEWTPRSAACQLDRPAAAHGAPEEPEFPMDQLPW